MRPTGRARTAWWTAAGLALAALLPAAATAAPQVTNVTPRGLQTGATTTLVIDGSELMPDARLVLPFPVAGQAVKPGSTAARLVVDVTLADSVPAGIYSLRVANPQGISNAVLIGVDDLPQVALNGPVAKLPVAVHGRISGTATAQTTFTGKKGQHVVVDVEARRLGAALDPLLTLYDSRHVQLAWAQSQARLSGDARLEADLPADGTYTVELHDALYRGAEPGFFRLKVGDLHYADLVFPLGVQRQTKASLEGIGRLPAGLRFAVAPGSPAHDVPAPLPRVPGLTGAAPLVLVGGVAEVVEADLPAGKLQDVPVPAAINGRIAKAGEEDRYRLLVKPGMALRFDVVANRAGSPLDGVLALRNEAGAQLMAADDRPDTVDPGFNYTVPAGVNALVVALKDLHGRGGADFVYRLAVTPANVPDFQLAIQDDRLHVPQGGGAVLRVRASRAGYGGPIKLTVPGLPAGVTLSGNEIAAGSSDALLSLTASPGTPLAQIVTELVGEAADPKTPIRRAALLPETPPTRRQPWLRAELALAVTPPVPIQLAWAPGDQRLPLGYGYPAAVKVARAAGVSGPVRFSLITSQTVPRTKDGKDDVNRAVRLRTPTTLPADKTNAVVPIQVPADLPSAPLDVALRAELLSGDGSRVVAAAVTPARRLQPSPPLVLHLGGPAAVEAKSGSGPAGKLKGRIERVGDFNKPVTVTLAGLPAGLPAPSLAVPPGQSDFELTVAFPANAKPGPLENVRLVASGGDQGQPAVRSNEIAVAVRVLPGEPAAPPGLLRVFEDEAAFVSLLTDGGGKAALEAADKFSGGQSLKVTPDQRFTAMLPGLGVKIRQNPGPGEYRYLRFAWKKRGGTAICLQLNHDGAWGPTGASPTKFRYHAGPGPECFGASLAVDRNLPVDWVVVTRDLFADFGEFTWTGLALSPIDGDYALFDHLYLARTPKDFEALKPAAAK
jgi:hypothetical protein